MKIVNVATSEQTATFYIDQYEDIFDSRDEAEIAGAVIGTVTVDALYVGGNMDNMRTRALQRWLDAE